MPRGSHPGAPGDTNEQSDPSASADVADAGGDPSWYSGSVRSGAQTACIVMLPPAAHVGKHADKQAERRVCAVVHVRRLVEGPRTERHERFVNTRLEPLRSRNASQSKVVAARGVGFAVVFCGDPDGAAIAKRWNEALKTAHRRRSLEVGRSRSCRPPERRHLRRRLHHRHHCYRCAGRCRGRSHRRHLRYGQHRRYAPSRPPRKVICWA